MEIVVALQFQGMKTKAGCKAPLPLLKLLVDLLHMQRSYVLLVLEAA